MGGGGIIFPFTINPPLGSLGLDGCSAGGAFGAFKIKLEFSEANDCEFLGGTTSAGMSLFFDFGLSSAIVVFLSLFGGSKGDFGLTVFLILSKVPEGELSPLLHGDGFFNFCNFV